MSDEEKKGQLSDDEIAKLLKEALEKPGVKEVMLVYGQWENFLIQLRQYNLVMKDKEVVTFSTSTSG